MQRFRFAVVLRILGLLGVAFGQAAVLSAEDFRVDNVVYGNNSQDPSAESTTIFHEGSVYDFMKSPHETVMFDKGSGRFVLMNLAQQARAELATGRILEIIEQLRLRAAKSKDPLMRFMAEPSFEEKVDADGRELTFSSTLLTYRVTLAPETNPNVVEQYREFCDGCARLRSLLQPASGPPAARLKVNAALAQRQSLPLQVELTMSTGKGLTPQHTTIRSVHRVARSLQPADLERVAQARKQMNSLKLIPFDQYRKLEPE